MILSTEWPFTVDRYGKIRYGNGMPRRPKLDEALVPLPARVLPRTVAALQRAAAARGVSIAELLDKLVERAGLYKP